MSDVRVVALAPYVKPHGVLSLWRLLRDLIMHRPYGIEHYLLLFKPVIYNIN